jgi:hypothetical protein
MQSPRQVLALLCSLRVYKQHMSFNFLNFQKLVLIYIVKKAKHLFYVFFILKFCLIKSANKSVLWYSGS